MANTGTLAPDFRLQGENENWVSLGDLLRRGTTLLAFYPGDFQPVCTRQEFYCKADAWVEIVGGLVKTGVIPSLAG